MGDLTISLLSMPTLRRLPATELMSFSLIHDLNSLTAKAAETPVNKEAGKSQTQKPEAHRFTITSQRATLTLFDEVFVVEADQDGGGYAAVSQQDAGQHG